MYDNNNGGPSRVARRVNGGLTAGVALAAGVLLACNTYAETGASNIGESSGSASAEIAVQKLSPVSEALDGFAARESADRRAVSIDTKSEVSDLGSLKTHNQHKQSQLALADSQRALSLNVIDTGPAVEFPQAVGSMGADPANYMPDVRQHQRHESGTSDSVDSGGQGTVFADKAGKGSKRDLWGPSTPDVHREVEVAERQPTEAASDATGSDSDGLPYAVILAIVALIGLVPVARRNDHHHRV